MMLISLPFGTVFLTSQVLFSPPSYEVVTMDLEEADKGWQTL